MAATLAVVLSVLAGCGGDDDGGDPVDTAPPASDGAESGADATADDSVDDDATGEDEIADDPTADDAVDDDATGDDAVDDASESADPVGGTAGEGGLEALVPPGVVGQNDMGVGTLYSSEAPFEDLVAHYDRVVGEANFVNEDELAATWVGEVDSTSISVNLSAGEGALLLVLVSELG